MIYTSRYFAALSEEIMRHQGTIDKFIGDAVMAFWNAPTPDPDHTVNACEAVLACLRKNDEVNEGFRADGWPSYTTRFGLHVGDAVIGNVGSSDRMNYTALGATVNLASRLEGLNKSYGTRVLVSAAVKARAEHRFIFRSIDRIKPKGFAEDVAIHELRCAREGDFAAELAFCRRWDEVYVSIERDDPTMSLAAITAFLSEHPTDGTAQFYAERLTRLQGIPSISRTPIVPGRPWRTPT